MFTHSQNSHFQYAYFIAGKCHTADEAYRVLRDQEETLERAIESYRGTILHKKAKRVRLTEDLYSKNVADKLDAEASLVEMDAAESQEKNCFDEAVRELSFVRRLIATVELHRKYKHLPDHEAMQACQREEWALELIHRAENFLLMNGSIPPDHWSTMRAHPDFETQIFPQIMEVQANRLKGKVFMSRLPQFVQEIGRLLSTPEPKHLLANGGTMAKGASND